MKLHCKLQFSRRLAVIHAKMAKCEEMKKYLRVDPYKKHDREVEAGWRVMFVVGATIWNVDDVFRRFLYI